MKMEYTYKFNDGTQNTVSVSETIGKALEGLDRKAENLERKERYYRQLSIDTLSCADKGELLPADEVVESENRKRTIERGVAFFNGNTAEKITFIR